VIGARAGSLTDGTPLADHDCVAVSTERALADPAAVFASPEEVLDEPDLTRDQKIAIPASKHGP
jgi:hypothetical protein